MFSVEIYSQAFNHAVSVHPSKNAAIVAARRWAKAHPLVYVEDAKGVRVWESKALRAKSIVR